MKIRVLSIASLLILLLPVVGGAGEKEVEDPRLNQKISVKESEINLYDLMSKISEQTQVNLSVDPKSSAWPVRERKLHLVTQNISLGEMMQGIKKLMTYSWRFTGSSDSPEYVLFQSQADRLREGKHLSQLNAIEIQQQQQRAQCVVDYYEQLLSMTPQQVESIRKSDPWGYLTATWAPMRSIAILINNLSPEQLMQISQGGSIELPYREMSPQMQAQAREFIIGLDEFIDNYDSNNPKPSHIQESSLQNASLSIVPIHTQNMDDQLMFGLVNIKGISGAVGGFPLMEPGSELARMMGTVIQDGREGKAAGNTNDDMDRVVSLEMARQKQLQVSQLNPTPKPPKDSMLLCEVEVVSGLDSGTDFEMIKQLSQSYQLSILCDFYPDAQQKSLPKGSISLSQTKRMPLYQLLNKVASVWGKTWFKEGSLILFQDAKWSEKRTWDVSQEWVRTFKDRHSTLTFQDAICLASCSRDQLQHTLAGDLVLGSLSKWVVSKQELLSFCGSLSTPQRAMAAGKGLPISQLGSDQWDLLTTALHQSYNCNAYDIQGSDLLFYTEQTSTQSVIVIKGENHSDYTLKLMLPAPSNTPS